MKNNMSVKGFFLSLIVLMLVAVTIGSAAVSAGPVPPIYVDADYIGQTSCPTDYTWNVDCFNTIQGAINTVASGVTINVAAGTYLGTLDLKGKTLTIEGADVDTTIIDASDLTGYAVQNFGSSSTIRGLTLKGTTNSYGFKISHVSDITLENIKVENSYSTGIDLNTVDGATLSNIEVTDTDWGFGLMILDSNDVTVTNVATSGNAWGGVSVQTKNAVSNNIVFSGDFDVQEDLPLLLEKDPSTYYDITNVDIPDKFNYVVYDFRKGDNYKQWFYQETLESAKSFAQDLIDSAAYEDILIYDVAEEDYYIIEGMNLQDAIDAASDGDTINVDVGTYDGQIVITNSLTLQGAGLETATIQAVGTGNVVTISASDVTISGFTISGRTPTEASPGYSGNGVYAYAPSGQYYENIVITENKFSYIEGVYFYSVKNFEITDNIMQRESRWAWYKPAGATPGSYANRPRGGSISTIWSSENGLIKNNEGWSPGVTMANYFSNGIEYTGNTVELLSPLLDGDDGITDVGLHIQSSNDVSVQENSFRDLQGQYPYSGYNHGKTGAAVNVLSSTGEINGNTFEDNTIGVNVRYLTGYTGETIVLRNNIFTENAYSVFNHRFENIGGWKILTAEVTLDAKNNLWGGIPNGPTIVSVPHMGATWGAFWNIVNGEGFPNHAVSDKVDYNPWWTDEAMTVNSVYLTTFNEIQDTLVTSGIDNNIDECWQTPTSCSGLYFEKVGYGKILFSNPLNLADETTIDFLQGLGEKLDMNAKAHIGFDATDSAIFRESGAVLYVYNFVKAVDQENVKIIVTDDDGNVLTDEQASNIVDNVQWLGACDVETGLCTMFFDVSHFTNFDVKPTKVWVDDGYTALDANDGHTWGYNAFDKIHDAINAVASGGTVYVVAGTYVQTGSLTIDKSITLIGTGEEKPTIQFDGKCDNVIIKADDITLEDIRFYKTNSEVGWEGSPTCAANVILDIPKGGWPDYLSLYGGLTIRDSIFEGGSMAMYINSKSDFTLEDSEFIDNSGADSNIIHIAAFEGTVTISNNIFASSSGRAVVVEPGPNEQILYGGTMNIIGNTLNGMRSLFVYNHWADDSKKVSINIEENTIDKTENSAITFFACGDISLDKLDEVVIIDNTITDSGETGIFADATSCPDWGIPTTVSGNPNKFSANRNSIYGSDDYGIKNDFPVTIDTTENYWGSKTPVFTSIVSGNVDYAPWYIDSGLTMLISEAPEEDQALADKEDVIVEEGKTDIIVPEGSPVQTINIPDTIDDDTQVTLDLSSMVTDTEAGKDVTLVNGLTLSRDTSTAIDYEVEIPAGTVISGPTTWTGVINVPTVQATSSVTPSADAGTTASVATVVEVGFGDTELTFNNAVRLLITGQAGKLAGYSRGGVFTKITTTCADDTQATNDLLPADTECKIDVGSDMVIWTKHFTKFVAYTQTTTSSGSTGGSSGHSGSGSNCAYSCAAWGSCVNGKQTRTCTPNKYCDESDPNKALTERTCSTAEEIPLETKNVEETTPIESEQGSQPTQETVSLSGKTFTGRMITELSTGFGAHPWLAGLLVTIMIGSLGIFVYSKFRKH